VESELGLAYSRFCEEPGLRNPPTVTWERQAEGGWIYADPCGFHQPSCDEEPWHVLMACATRHVGGERRRAPLATSPYRSPRSAFR